MQKEDKIRSEIEASLAKFGESIEKLEREAERQPEKFDVERRAQVEKLKQQKAIAEAKLKEMGRSEGDDRHRLAKELEGYVRDMDENFRGSLSYLIH